AGPQFPATSPHVTAVGGTHLVTASNGRGWTETVWSGAGSGCSAYEKKPEWQTDEGCENRTMADVAAVADPATPVSIYSEEWEQGGASEKGWLRIGGTSASAPILAGVEARLSAEERAEGAALFWRKGSEGTLFDVAEGRNGHCSLDYLCAGKVGYDGPSGWGTPGGSRPAAPVVGAYEATDITPQGATLNGAINPNGEPTTYRFEWGTTTEYGNVVPAKEASAGSGTEAVEVSEEISGLTSGTSYHYRLVATNPKGTTNGGDHSLVASPWTLQFPPADPEASALADVSCLSAAACMAAGSYPLPIVDGSVFVNPAPLGEHWNGSEWIAEKTLPGYESEEIGGGLEGGYDSFFEGVSCASVTECIAVGVVQEPGKGQLPLAENWEGTEWTPMPTPPVPSDAATTEVGLQSVELRDVSCTSATACVAVGDYASKFSPEVRKALIERWDGSEWQVVASPSPPKQHSSLRGVSCVSATLCVAVGHQGSDSPTSLEGRTLIERWDGSEWGIQASPD
ncbi:MAG: hypothetical protein ACREMY_06885, partial [bacterium]